jgi:uncharacterized protein
MKELLEAIAKALVDNPDQVQVGAIEGEHVTVLELRVHRSDLGRVIGRARSHATTARPSRILSHRAFSNFSYPHCDVRKNVLQ